MLRILELFDGGRRVGLSVWSPGGRPFRDGVITDVLDDGVHYGGEIYTRAEIADVARLRFVRLPASEDATCNADPEFPCIHHDHGERDVRLELHDPVQEIGGATLVATFTEHGGAIALALRLPSGLAALIMRQGAYVGRSLSGEALRRCAQRFDTPLFALRGWVHFHAPDFTFLAELHEYIQAHPEAPKATE